MFIPVTKKECEELNWQTLDVVLVSGDAYIDTSYSGVAVIGHYLIEHGFRVGIIPQPNINSPDDILSLGEPDLFWGVTAGAMDSMVSNYTSNKKRRNNDDLTDGGINNRRPDYATIKYVNLIKQYASKKTPIVLGGIEASLRRLAHYDFWANKLKRSVLLDSKADFLVYGEGERTIVEIANLLKQNNHEQIKTLRGLCYIDNHKPELANYINLPSFEQLKDKQKFSEFFNLFYENNDPLNASGLIQQYNSRWVVQNPPQHYLINQELDFVYNMPFENKPHPIYTNIKATETTKNSITTHRGCVGSCSFCAIALHQGRQIRSRSVDSILLEVKILAEQNSRKKNKNQTLSNTNHSNQIIINNIGGPTANMYDVTCPKWNKTGACKNKLCLFPTKCNSLQLEHRSQLHLINAVRKLSCVRDVFIKSGVRYDLVLMDKKYGNEYLNLLVKHCTAGQIKIAPEHYAQNVLSAMGKPNADIKKFVSDFYKLTEECGKKQFVTFYLLAGHPGSQKNDKLLLQRHFKQQFGVIPEQITQFTPTPSTLSTLQYYLNLP